MIHLCDENWNYIRSIEPEISPVTGEPFQYDMGTSVNLPEEFDGTQELKFDAVQNIWIVKNKAVVNAAIMVEGILSQLMELDGKVIRHFEERELGIKTTLTDEEFKNHLLTKQNLREEMALQKSILKDS